MTQAHDFSASASSLERDATGRGRVMLRYREQGQGAPVLLLHGFSDSLETFWELGIAQRLAEDFRVVAFDARGHGRSSKRHDPASYTDPERVADAASVLDAARIEAAHVLGYSMGGWTAMLLALHAPERVRSLIVGGAQPYGQSLAPLREALGSGRWTAVLERHCGSLSDDFRARLTRNDPLALAATVAMDRAALPSPLVAPKTLWFKAEREPLAAGISMAAERWSPGRCVTLASANHFDALAHPGLLPALRDFLCHQC